MRLLFLTILLVSSLLSKSNSTDNSKVVLQLSWLHQFQFAGYYIAKEKGYYKDFNIDVDIKEFHSDTNLSTVLETKEADFAVGRSSLAVEKAYNRDVVALFATFQKSPLMLLVRKDSNIQTIQDLKNKKIMMTPDATETASITAMLTSQKVKLEDITIIPHSFNLNDLINNKVDAMASYVSNEPLRLEEKGIEYTVFHPKDYGFDFYSDILFTSNDFIQKNPTLVKKFYDATEKGWQYAFENIGKTAKLIFDKYNTQNKSLVELVSEGEALKKLIYHQNTTSIGCLDKEKFQRIINIYKVTGLIRSDIDLDTFIYKHNKHDSLTLRLTHDQILTYSLIALLIAVIFTSIVVYFIITKKWLITKFQLEQEIKVKTERLHKQTFTDFLTKASNKKAYSAKIKEELSRFKRYNQAFSMILFDIDNFKYINDTYGHSAGDKVLKRLVKIVKSTIRQSDFLFRVGGEEFVVIFPNTTLNQAKIVSEHLRKNVESNLNKIDEVKKETITISIGLCEVSDEDNAKSIYTKTDNLMYKSKHNGKNTITF